jgi:predicted HNH restriction endonuclease
MGEFFVQICEFDFHKVYKERGIDLIEGHHKKMVSQMSEGEKTKVEDIALV